MTLKGLTIPIWVGWLCGIVVLKRPWGSPSLPSWCTFSLFYCVLGILLYLLITVDFLFNNSGGLLMGDEHKFGRYVRAFNLTQYVVVTLLKRITFIKNAKRLGKLLGILSEYDKCYLLKKKDERDKWGWRKKAVVVPILIYSSFFISLVSIVTKGVEFVLENAKKPSWFKMWGMGPAYGGFFFIFAVVPLGFTSNIAYSCIMVTTLKVSKIFCDFCSVVKDSLPLVIADGNAGNIRGREGGNLEIYSILKMRSKSDWEKKRNACVIVGKGRNKIHCLSETKMECLRLPEIFSNRQEIIDKFEEIKKLMVLTNDTLSSLMLYMISGMTLGMVSNASQIFVTGHLSSGLNLVVDVITFPLLTIYAMLLELGHKIGRMQREAKLELHKELLNTPWSSEKEEIEDVIQDVIQYDWKLSACGFFTIDRRLASGIFSLVLNYVVILVQLNIALDDDDTASGIPTNGTSKINITVTPTMITTPP